MMKFFRNTKGAVSIFLLIILIPMLTVASVMVDSSRLKLAQSTASAAGDLALNTALSQYNNLLKDVYGLFATSQNNEEILANLQDYYTDSIVAGGIPLADAQDYVGQFMSMFGSQAGTTSDDILNMALSDFTITAPEGANLANPVMMKKQVVEFMKFRAPLELGTDLLDAVKIFKNLSKQTDSIAKQQEFYKAEKKVLSLCEEAWVRFHNYSLVEYVINESYYEKMEDDFTGKEAVKDEEYAAAADIDSDIDEYETYHEKLIKATTNMVWYLYLKDYYKTPIYTMRGSTGSYSLKKGNSQIKGGTVSGTKNTAKLRPEIANLEQKIAKVQSYIDGNDTLYKNLKFAADNPSTTDDRVRVQSVEQYNQACNKSSGYIYDVIQLKKAYDKFLSAYNAGNLQKDPEPQKPTEPTEPTQGENESDEDYQDRLDAYEEKYAAYEVKLTAWTNKTSDEWKTWKKNNEDTGCTLTTGLSASCSYSETGAKHTTTAKTTKERAEKLLGEFVKISTQISTNYTNTKKSFNMSQLETDTNTLLKEVHDDSKKVYKDNIQKKIGELSKAKTALNNVYSLLTGDFQTKLNSWSTAANQSDLDADETTQTQRDEIDNLKKIFKPEDVKQLIQRVQKVAEQTLPKTMNELSQFKYCTKLLWNINTTVAKTKSSLKSACSSAGYDLSLLKLNKEDTLNTDTRKMFNKAYTHTSGKEIKANDGNNLITDSWSDEMANPSPSVNFATTRFYNWLYQNFETGDEKEPDKQIGDESDEMQEEQTDKLEDAAEESKKAVDNDNKNQSKNEVKNMGTKPSASWGTDSQKLSVSTDTDQNLTGMKNGLDSLFSTLIKTVESGLVTIRDGLYIDSYVLNSFSYDTFEAEIYYEAEKKGMPIGDSFFTDTKSTVNSTYAKYVDAAKSLTNTPINPTNNFAYGAEVEYVLYGGTNENNVKAAYATIFGVRLALNLVYAFTDSSIRDTAFAIASAMFGAPPLTPLIPIAKAAIIVATAIAETSYDIYTLKRGEPVPLYKSSDTWVMSIKGLMNKGKDMLADAATKAINTGYNKLNEWVSKTSEELQKDINSGAKQLKEAVSDTLQDTFEKYAYSAIDKLEEACLTANQLQATGDLQRVEEKVDFVCEELDNWLSQQLGDSPIITSIKETAVSTIQNNSKAYIEEMFDLLQNKADTAVSTTADNITKKIESLQKKLEENISSVVDSGSGKLGTLVSNLENEIIEAAKSGADNLKDVVTSKIDAAFGSSTSVSAEKGSAKVVNSLLSWQYSDYLRLFLIIETIANEEKVLLRTADLVQANMQHLNKDYNSGTSFLMKKANTYLKVEATIAVEPLMLAIPMIEETVHDQLSGVNWYTINYSATRGY